MKKLGFWIIFIIPTVNILIMNLFQYIENVYIKDGAYNWWIDLLLLIVILIFYVLHYVLAFAIPILFYKRQSEFSARIGLLSILSIFVANIIMSFELGELKWYVSLNDIPQHMVIPVSVTMATVIIVSILFLFIQNRDAFISRRRA